MPNLKCPLPAITSTTDRPDSGGQQQQQQSPTTPGDEGGDDAREEEEEDEQAPPQSGTKKHEQPIILPNLLRIPMNDGDNPTCYDATYGLMPVGVCQNPQQTPQPSKYDVFMNRNIDLYARAWKLIDCQLGSCFSSPPPPPPPPQHTHTHLKTWSNTLWVFRSISPTLIQWTPNLTCVLPLLGFIFSFFSLAWPGMRECLPSQQDNGIWCCRFYSYLFLWADVCWPLVAIENLNSRGIGYWQGHQFNNPLILPPWEFWRENNTRGFLYVAWPHI